MLLGLLRHGETEGGQRFRGHTDHPLTPKGLSQMYTAVADSGRWDRLVSSPLSRCATFAKALARQQALSLTFDDRLKEIHFGTWEGRCAEELMAEDPDALARFWQDPDTYPPPQGESLGRFQARVLDAWRDILQTQSGERVLLVTHGGVIRVLLCHTRGIPVSRWHEFEVAHGQLHRVLVGSTDTPPPEPM